MTKNGYPTINGPPHISQIDQKGNDVVLSIRESQPTTTTQALVHRNKYIIEHKGPVLRPIARDGAPIAERNRNGAGSMPQTEDMPIIQPSEAKSVKSEYNARCCSGTRMTVDRKFITFIVQTMIIMCVLIFSMHQVVNEQDSSRRETFIVIMTTTLSVCLPSPQIPQTKSKEEKHMNNNVQPWTKPSRWCRWRPRRVCGCEGRSPAWTTELQRRCCTHQ